ncbi:MAG: hypothetical protein ABII27_06965 [bacterium]
MRLKIFTIVVIIFSISPVSAAAAGEKFGFGIEYFMFLDSNQIAYHYSDIGATWSKTTPVKWGDIEKKPPVKGVHNYNWDKVDKNVKAMHDAGFVNLQIVLAAKSKWGGRPLKRERGLVGRLKTLNSAAPPTDEHWQDYADWVRAFTERYDNDGVDDMPGLKAPVLYYEIMTEVQHDFYWQGTAEEYIEVLKTSYKAAKEANHDVKIILSGFMFMDLFDKGYLTADEIEERLNWATSYYPKGDFRKKSGEKMRKQIEFNKRILQAKDYFDIVEFHLLSHYKAIPGTVKWIRDQMKKNGYQKPIWVGDAGILPPLPSHNRTGRKACFSTFNVFFPSKYDDGDKIYKVLTRQRDKYGYTFNQVSKWFYKKQAQILTKSLIEEMSLGVAGTNIYTWLDGKPRKIMTGSAKSWQICGLRDGNFLPSPAVGTPRPVFYTYKMIVEQLGDFSSAEKLDLGDSKIKAYKFIVKEQPIYAIWYDDEVAQKPGEKEAAKIVDLSQVIKKSNVTITHIITERDQTEPKVETESSNDIMITETPIFIK